ncbi:hypothetical protein AOLI_G00103550 [Acnodon oligacanthus]
MNPYMVVNCRLCSCSTPTQTAGLRTAPPRGSVRPEKLQVEARLYSRAPPAGQNPGESSSCPGLSYFTTRQNPGDERAPAEGQWDTQRRRDSEFSISADSA